MVKIIHFAIVNGDRYDVEQLGKALKKVRDDLKNEYEFLITNDRVQPRDPINLFKEYEALYFSLKELSDKYEKEAEKNEKNKSE